MARASEPGVYRIVHIPTGREYIGSSTDIGRRKRGHLYRLRNGIHAARHMQACFNKYGEGEFVFEILQRVPVAELVATEQYFIDTRKPAFNSRPLASTSLGWHHSEETKRKLSAFWKGKKYSAERVAKSTEARRGYKPTPETIEKRASQARGRPLSASHRAAIGNAHRGRKQSPELVAKRVAALRGHKMPPAHLEKLRLINTGRPLSEEHRQKLSEAMKRYRRDNPRPQKATT